MQELNARVDLDKQKPEEVAQEYLESFGFIAEELAVSRGRGREPRAAGR